MFFWGLGSTGLNAQTALTATGEDASGIGGSTNYSIGQVANKTNTGTKGTVTQGVQQPYEILIETGLEDTRSISLKISASPNTTTDFLTLS